MCDPTHHCQASFIIAFCQDCGIRFPVVADACQSPDKSRRMPLAEGSVEGTPVNVLRDTGCSTIVVRRALVPDYKLMGREKRCIREAVSRAPSVERASVERRVSGAPVSRAP